MLLSGCQMDLARNVLLVTEASVYLTGDIIADSVGISSIQVCEYFIRRPNHL